MKKVSFTAPSTIRRQQAYVNQLRGQAQQPVQGQMVGNQYVAPSWTQNLNKALSQVLAGKQSNSIADAEANNQAMRQSAMARALAGDKSALNDPSMSNVAETVLAQRIKNQYGGDAPSTVREWEYFNKLPPAKQTEYLRMKRADKILNQGDRFGAVNPANPSDVTNIAPINIAPDQTVSHKANVAGASENAKQGAQIQAIPVKAEAERQADLATTQTKTEAAIGSKSDKTEMLDSLIDKAKDAAGVFTTGFVGGNTAGVYGTPAHDLAKTLDTIKSNIGFDRLQEMRDNSKTGGALGQVSEMENKLLQSVWGSLEQSQGTEQFKENLELVRKQVKQSWARVMAAYKQDYGVEYVAPENPAAEKSNNDPLSIR